MQNTASIFNPNALVTTEWVSENLHNPNVRLVESNEDPLLFRSSHIAQAVEIDWVRDLNDPLRRDYLDAQAFQELCSRAGISLDTRVVFYGDKSNWWACYAFWVFSLFGHQHLSIMDGGRTKWELEGRPLTREIFKPESTEYPLRQRNDSQERAFRDGVLAHVRNQGTLVDVRSPDEFSGKRLHMPEYPNEGALRGGHIPGAKNIPWAKAINPQTGEFLPVDDLRKLYIQDNALDGNQDIIAYCRIGERSSHTWFVLTQLLGFPKVKNYDGSWTEWGNLVGVPIEK